MKPIQGYNLITQEDLHWRPSNLMRIPNADFLSAPEARISARVFGGIAAKSAGTLHKHIRQEEFYFVLEGTGRLREGDATLTVPRYGGVLVGPDQLRQVFNRHRRRGALASSSVRRRKLELFAHGQDQARLVTHLSGQNPKQLPKELAGVEMAAEKLNFPTTARPQYATMR
jgi:mannose-6-phosphate isomerase-like protein (cupin superfamily)